MESTATPHEVFILTVGFPYGEGETFLEEEIRYWAARPDCKVTLLPFSKADTCREVPANIAVKDWLCWRHHRLLKHMVLSLGSRLFWREVLVEGKWRAVRHFRSCGAAVALSLWVRDQLRQHGIPQGALLYSYWFDIQAYGAALYAQQRHDITLITRTHRFDLYKEYRPGGYMPLKDFLAKAFQRIYTISEEGKEYLLSTYPVDAHRVKVARLGTAQHAIQQGYPEAFHLLSCSAIRPVKQLHKLVEALSLIPSSFPVRWTHLGSGTLHATIEQYAAQKLGSKPHIQYEFLGQLQNEEVIRYYQEHGVSCFVNCSQSEGVPVSIMEAQSFGIPVIAPNVGGMAELITEATGILLPAEFTVEQLAEAIQSITKFHTPATRECIVQHWASYYDASHNYPRFIEEVLSLL